MIKRIIDIILSLIIIIFSVPFIVMILLIVFFVLKEFPFFIQERKIILDKNKVKIIKIKTIKTSKYLCELENKCDNIFLKKGFNRFVPPFCRWLRKTGIDELPQMINVLKGEMSLIGPRPFPIYDLKILKRYEPELYDRRENIKSKPGITGYWQVFGNRQQGASNLIECDEWYENQKSIYLDFVIFFKTLFILITAKHSDAIITNTINKTFKVHEELINNFE